MSCNTLYFLSIPEKNSTDFLFPQSTSVFVLIEVLISRRASGFARYTILSVYGKSLVLRTILLAPVDASVNRNLIYNSLI